MRFEWWVQLEKLGKELGKGAILTGIGGD